MSCILSIETSTDVCSVAVSDNGAVIFNKEDHSGPNHAVKLGLFVDEAISYIDSRNIPLEAVAVSCGPGSYTGLRIGVSMAKGLCYGRGAKLIAVPTLELLAVPVLLGEHPAEEDALVVPMLDARRMEVYTAAYDFSLTPMLEPRPLILDSESYGQLIATGRPLLLFGDGSAKAADVVKAPNVRIVEDVDPLAVDMIALAERAYSQRDFLDLAYCVPTYLKDFMATKPKSLF